MTRRQSATAWMKLGDWSETHAWQDFPPYRKEYLGTYCDAMIRWGMIEAWAWADGETEFLYPMTKPGLSEGQRAVMLCEFLCYCRRFTRQVAYLQQLLERADRILGKKESKRLEGAAWRGKLSAPEIAGQVVAAEAAAGVYLSTADEFDPVEWSEHVEDQIERERRNLLRRAAEERA
jgi:hypothetical protein